MCRSAWLDDLPVYVKNGRYGPYVQWGDADAPPPGEAKPKMASLLSSQSPESLSLDDAVDCSRCRASWASIRPTAKRWWRRTAATAPTCRRGRSRARWPARSSSSPSPSTRRSSCWPSLVSSAAAPPAKPPLREFGADPVSGRPVVAKDGRFGVYVTDGETNASIGRGDRLEQMAPERAFELLAIRREQVGDKPAKRGAKKAPAKAGGAKRAAGKKAAPAKKATAKKSAPRKRS